MLPGCQLKGSRFVCPRLSHGAGTTAPPSRGGNAGKNFSVMQTTLPPCHCPGQAQALYTGLRRKMPFSASSISDFCSFIVHLWIDFCTGPTIFCSETNEVPDIRLPAASPTISMSETCCLPCLCFSLCSHANCAPQTSDQFLSKFKEYCKILTVCPVPSHRFKGYHKTGCTIPTCRRASRCLDITYRLIFFDLVLGRLYG